MEQIANVPGLQLRAPVMDTVPSFECTTCTTICLTPLSPNSLRTPLLHPSREGTEQREEVIQMRTEAGEVTGSDNGTLRNGKAI